VNLDLKINADLQPSALAEAFSTEGRVHIPEFLTAVSAQRLADAISNESRWNLVSQLAGQHVDLSAAGMAELEESKRQEFLSAVHQQAGEGFQYLYENFPLYDVVHHKLLPGHPLEALFSFLNAQRFLDFCRELTGQESIGFADVQVTRFRPGHFLASHDDAVAGKERVAAYVLNMTREWSEDWGGQLLFFDDDGHVNGGFTPTWNALNVFRVPARHSVALVAPFAKQPRVSVTGWLRAGKDPGPG
jgi:Rps23 Pro-64 3,4-dihydroxylase Tpa1-like proline 4-hydroxylase